MKQQLKHQQSVRKGAWTQEEDILLKKCIAEYGEGMWRQVPIRAGLNRCRKSCRLRWFNYLCPNIKRGAFAEDEIDLIVRLHRLLGNRWSLIAGRLPGRTANDVKNYWNTHLRKKFAANGEVKECPLKYPVIKPHPRTLSKNSISSLHDQQGQQKKRPEQQEHPEIQLESVILPIAPPISDEDLMWLNHVLLADEPNEFPCSSESAVEDLRTRFLIEGMDESRDDRDVLLAMGNEWDCIVWNEEALKPNEEMCPAL